MLIGNMGAVDEIVCELDGLMNAVWENDHLYTPMCAKENLNDHYLLKYHMEMDNSIACYVE